MRVSGPRFILLSLAGDLVQGRARPVFSTASPCPALIRAAGSIRPRFGHRRPKAAATGGS